MGRSLSWIDQGELAHALSRAEGRRKGLDVPPDAQEWTNSSAITREMEALAAQRALDPILEGPISARAGGFCDWARNRLGAEAACIADADGLIIHSSGASEGDAAASALLATALRGIGPLLGGAALSAAVESDSGRLAQVIWSPTRVGLVAAVLVSPAPLDLAKLKLVRAALVRVFE